MTRQSGMTCNIERNFAEATTGRHVPGPLTNITSGRSRRMTLMLDILARAVDIIADA